MYTVNYFIEKFTAIPEDRWCVGALIKGDKRCARGHCYPEGYKDYLEIFKHPYAPADVELSKLFFKHGINVVHINNARTEQFRQPTPKQRILAALLYIKAREMQVEISDPPVTVEELIGSNELVEF